MAVSTNPSSTYDYRFKILLVGPSGSGKTCLMLQFSDSSFLKDHIATIGVEFKLKTIELDDKIIKLEIRPCSLLSIWSPPQSSCYQSTNKEKDFQLFDQLPGISEWDTAGQERFRSITRAFYRGAYGIILVYDVSDRSSFDCIESWFDQVENYSSENTTRLLIANKCDLESQRKVDFSEGQNLAKRLGMTFMETSAKDSTNVERVFITMAAEIKSRYPVNKHSDNLKLGQTKPVCKNPVFAGLGPCCRS